VSGFASRALNKYHLEPPPAGPTGHCCAFLALADCKLALYVREWEREALEEAVGNLPTEWELDLRPLFPQLVHYKVARERVEDLIE